MQSANEQRLAAAYADMITGRHEQAHAALTDLLAKGESGSLTYLGWMYERGLGVATDEEHAADMYRRACEQGNMLGCFYWASLKFRRGDVVGALESYVRAADAGHPSAAYWASAIYEGEGGYPANPSLARHYLGLAAERGHVFAQRDLAKQQLFDSSSLMAKASAMLRYLQALLKGLAMIIRNAEDPRVR